MLLETASGTGQTSRNHSVQTGGSAKHVCDSNRYQAEESRLLRFARHRVLSKAPNLLRVRLSRTTTPALASQVRAWRILRGKSFSCPDELRSIAARFGANPQASHAEIDSVGPHGAISG